jgi:hypothetical protein
MGAGTGGPAFGRKNNFTPGGPRVKDPNKTQKQALAEQALQVVVDLMNGSESDIVKLNAANSIQNRILGMPRQTMDANVNTPPPAEENDGADEIILRRLAATQPANTEG